MKIISIIPARSGSKRVKNKKNPLKGDLDHLHHLLIKRYSLTKTLVVYLILVNLPIYLLLLYKDILLILIIFTLATYFYLISKLS